MTKLHRLFSVITAAGTMAGMAMAPEPAKADTAFRCGSAEQLRLASAPSLEEHACIDVVFILDTTGSMANLIEGAKLKIWSIATEILSARPRPHVRFGLVAYRDRGDAYVTHQVALSDDLDSVYADLLAFGADGGGDSPESVNQALYEGIAEMAWNPSPHTLRLAFLVGDAPPHMDYPDDIKFPDTLALARQNDIVVNALQAGRMAETTSVWRKIAAKGGGHFARIPQSGGMQQIDTPYDQDIYRLQQAMNETAIPYGKPEDREEYALKLGSIVSSVTATADRAAAAYAEPKAGLVYGGRDLVDAVAAGEIALDDVDPNQLPSDMRNLDTGALGDIVEARQSERTALRDKITGLTADRLAYLAGMSDKRDESFDGEVKDMVRGQAAGKGFVYDD